MTIVWSQKAGETFQRNIDCLKENWPEIEVRNLSIGFLNI